MVPYRSAFFFSSQAHLKSEIIYNWEKNMHHASDKPTLRKKENKKASSFLSWIGFREKKLEWVRKPKTPPAVTDLATTQPM